MSLNRKRQLIKNQSGFLAMDFLFGIVLVVGLLLLVLSMAFTMTTIEVAQYVVFASARTGATASSSPGTSQDFARQKFDNLTGQQELAYMNNSNIFNFRYVDIGPTGFDEYGPQESGEPNMNWGFVAQLTPIILDFHIPYFGSSTSNPGDPRELATTITSFLGRSPSQTECLNFSNFRFSQGIMQLGGEPQFGSAPNAQAYAMEDNGC